MAVAWIARDPDGTVSAACLVAFATPEVIEDLRYGGRVPELVDYGDEPITIPAPLPPSARVLERLELAQKSLDL